MWQRWLAPLVHLRHGATHDVPTCWFSVDRSTITRAIGEVRPLLAERGCTVSRDVRHCGPWLRSSHLGATGSTGIVDGTEKSMVVTDSEGRVLWCSPTDPGSCAESFAPQR
ncbi:transposase family protein [Streptomyces sp. NPDC048604]|uniref:helix-turn-helix domain-containing protein n=1 Tax=Streptomyces sp. NPDC048604 TaxID=3365578 RepID=UPI00371E089F